MERLIRVELKDGAICRMAQKAFNLFLAQDKIVRFERSDGWVVIGKDPLRDLTKLHHHSGPERRCAI